MFSRKMLCHREAPPDYHSLLHITKCQRGGRGNLLSKNNYIPIYIMYYNIARWQSSVDIMSRLRAGGLRNRGSIPGSGKGLFILQNVQSGSGSHAASYSMGTLGPGVKRLSCKVTSPHVQRNELAHISHVDRLLEGNVFLLITKSIIPSELLCN
jgi:hypothetical protein